MNVIVPVIMIIETLIVPLMVVIKHLFGKKFIIRFNIFIQSLPPTQTSQVFESAPQTP